jgi:predicted transcriptional regulator
MQTHLIYGKMSEIWKHVGYEEELKPEVKALREKLRDCKLLAKQKVEWKEIKRIMKMGRSSYYRYVSLEQKIGIKGLIARSKRPKKLRESKIVKSTIDMIKKIRKENATYGKAKITVILRRDHGILISESSVGRVLKKLLETGKILRSASARPIKRKRVFRKHAKRWEYGKSKPQQPGEMVQIDHMSVSKNNTYLKDFQAWDPISKYVDAQVFTNATSHSAKKFLHQLIRNAPFKIYSVQVDGGSEFMAEFEQACADLDIALFVLPPKKPEYNGGVERSNRIFREEFYARSDLLADTVGAFRVALKVAVAKYNSYSPHQSIDFLTPLEYIKNYNDLAHLSNML